MTDDDDGPLPMLRLSDREALRWELETRARIWTAALTAVVRAEESGCSIEDVVRYLDVHPEELPEWRRACRVGRAGIIAYLGRFEGDLAAMENAKTDEDVGSLFAATRRVQQWMTRARCAWVWTVMRLPEPVVDEESLLPDTHHSLKEVCDLIEMQDVSRDVIMRYNAEAGQVECVTLPMGLLEDYVNARAKINKRSGPSRPKRSWNSDSHLQLTALDETVRPAS